MDAVHAGDPPNGASSSMDVMSAPVRFERRLATRPRRIPLSVLLIGGFVAFLGTMTSNPILTPACVIVLVALVVLLWRPAEPPVMLFVAGFQWVNISTLILVADWEEKPVTALSISPHVETALWLSFIGLLVLSIGMRIGAGRSSRSLDARGDAALRALSIDRVFGLYLVAAAGAAIVPYVVWRVLPLAQFLLALAALKWVAYVVLGYVTLRRRAKGWYFALATVLEFVAGIGFFAEFKTVFFVFALVILTLHHRFTLRTTIVAALIAGVVFVFGAAWMSIREEYRGFLNQGTGQQVVLVSPVEQLTAFGDLIADVDAESLSESVNMVLKRVAYVDFFAAVIDYVPRQHQYENGGVLWRSLVHVLLPRFIYRSKPILESDSEITMRYTGLTVASADRGTSIGIGYMAEAYVDFGPQGMFVLILTFGLLWGWMYAFLVKRAPSTPIGLAFGTALLIHASEFELAEIKLLGGMIARFLVLAVVLRYAMPWIQGWLLNGPVTSQVREHDATDAEPAAAPAAG